MTQLLEIVQKLNDGERREVQDFPEFLLARRQSSSSAGQTGEGERAITFEGWAGCLGHVHPEMSDGQFNELILNEWTKAAEE